MKIYIILFLASWHGHGIKVFSYVSEIAYIIIYLYGPFQSRKGLINIIKIHMLSAVDGSTKEMLPVFRFFRSEFRNSK